MTFTDESMREVAGLPGVVLSQDDLSSTLDEVARVAVRAVGPCDGASLTTFQDGIPAVVAADGAWARRLDELQYEEREGPCLDAARTGNVFRVRDLAYETRWPFYVVRAAEAGARSMVSLPMAAEGKILGAFNVYSRQPDAFDAQAVSVCELIAAQAGIATQVAASFFRHRDLGEQLRTAMQSRAVIEQAKGVLMAARRCTDEQAFDLLVQLSQTSNRKLRDVAQALVDGVASGG
jgi:transcriptional regulator with GAF, ATPase, and Fis domain